MKNYIFGVKTEGQFDILYPCHSQADVDRAARLGVAHQTLECAIAQATVYFEVRIDAETMHRITAFALEAVVNNQYVPAPFFIEID